MIMVITDGTVTVYESMRFIDPLSAGRAPAPVSRFITVKPITVGCVHMNMIRVNFAADGADTVNHVVRGFVVSIMADNAPTPVG